MKPWQSIVTKARTGLIASGACLCLGLLLVLFFHDRQQSARSALSSSKAELVELQSRRSSEQADLNYVQKHIGRFNYLVQAGIIEKPERETWIEQLLLSARRAGLPASPHYTLHPAKPVSSKWTAGHAAALSTGMPQFHDLEFSLSEVHEEELLALLLDFGRNTRQRFRVNACQLSQATRQGLTLQCVLRFFSLAQTTPRAPSVLARSTIAGPVPAAPQLGTLFYMPVERNAIVLERGGDAAPGFNRQARVSGVVLRERGNSTSWINSRVLADGQPFAPATVTHISADAVAFNGRRVPVGDALDFRTGASTGILPAGALEKAAPK